MERGARMAARFHLPGDSAAWLTASENIKSAILKQAWDDRMQSLTEHLGGGGLDASLLSLPLRRVLPADHPRMIATTAAIASRLGAGKGLLYRYIPEISPDGLPGHEGAFLLCSFLMVDNLATRECWMKPASSTARSVRAGALWACSLRKLIPQAVAFSATTRKRSVISVLYRAASISLD